MDQRIYPHHESMIGQAVVVYNNGWADMGLPRAGFIDGYAEDEGMFSITVDMSQADHRRGTAPRIYLRRVLVVPSKRDKPVGVDVYALIRSPIQADVPKDVASPGRPDDFVDRPGPTIRIEQGTPPRTKETTQPTMSDYAEPDGEDEIPPATPARAPARAASREAAEPLPPGLRSADDGPAAPDFGDRGGPGIVPEKPQPGAEEPRFQHPRATETRGPIDQMLASPAWLSMDEIGEGVFSIDRTGEKELSIMLVTEDKPVAKILWISAKKARSDAETEPHGFAIKIRDRGGRCSVTVAEHLTKPDEVQAAISLLARCVTAANRAEPGDWGSSAANMLMVKNAATE